jgi:hypothetical protein
LTAVSTALSNAAGQGRLDNVMAFAWSRALQEKQQRRKPRRDQNQSDEEKSWETTFLA